MNDVNRGYGANVALNPGGSLGTGGGGGAIAQAPQSAALTSAMFERLGRLDEHANRLEQLADRIVGPEPAKPAQTNGPQSTTPGHVTARMDACVEIAEMQTQRIAEALRRLERFA